MYDRGVPVTKTIKLRFSEVFIRTIQLKCSKAIFIYEL